MIYMICMKEYVKIGRSKDPNSRLKQIQTGNPEDLEMWEIHGVEEAEMHALFKNLRIREEGNGKEWFRRKGNLRDYLDGYKDIVRDERGNLTLVRTSRSRPTGIKRRSVVSLSLKHLIERMRK